MNKMNLSVRKIFDKEFSNKKIGGIDQTEVDEFLDLVIEDYETIAAYIKDIKEANQRLRDENYKLKKDKLQYSAPHKLDDDSFELMQNTVVLDIPKDSERLNSLETKIDRLEKIILSFKK